MSAFFFLVHREWIGCVTKTRERRSCKITAQSNSSRISPNGDISVPEMCTSGEMLSHLKLSYLPGWDNIFALSFRAKYYYDVMAFSLAWRYHRKRCHGVMLCATKTTFKWKWDEKSVGEIIINHHMAEGRRKSHPRVRNLQHSWLGKPRCGLQIMCTRMWFPCPFRNLMIDSINSPITWSGCQK